MMNSSKNIPWFLVLIGSGFLLLMAWSIFLAGQRTSAVIDRDYYSHGLRYNETLLERQAAAALGWRLSTELKGRTLIVHLVDKLGRPVSSARGALYLSKASDPSGEVLMLQEIAPGLYQTHLATGISGEINARLEFRRDGALLNRQLLLNP
jgi:nitrogen fixation protein FixH